MKIKFSALLIWLEANLIKEKYQHFYYHPEYDSNDTKSPTNEESDEFFKIFVGRIPTDLTYMSDINKEKFINLKPKVIKYFKENFQKDISKISLKEFIKQFGNEVEIDKSLIK